ncbi:conserved Plasmodium protein, unknown function [Plasmodium chabaudi chabaudi]|uniref:Uncharacterized protein n=1 Tax=Plasmodium chabaudi chabaudi TaxID=31271 RepID=A0A1D3S127_PLACU|nr:conserved Plasmodium protein, unknown function [Plasmodium chabaudi chabaudi]
MIEFDELFELLKEVEISCDNFNEENKEKEKIILFLNDLNSYINDISYSLKVKTNKTYKISEIDILKKIISKKERLENVIKNSNKEKKHILFKKINNIDWEDKHDDTSLSSPSLLNETATLEKNVNTSKADINQEKEEKEGEEILLSPKRDTPKKEMSDDKQNNILPNSDRTNNSNNVNFKKFEEVELIKDNLIKEWGSQIDEYDNLKYEFSYEYKKMEFQKKLDKRKNINTVEDDNIDDELCLLAQEMKENVLAYRQILTEDNKTLEISANKQVNNIDSILDVNKKTKRMGSNQSISFFLSLIIIVVSMLLFMFTFFVIILL